MVHEGCKLSVLILPSTDPSFFQARPVRACGSDCVYVQKAVRVLKKSDLC